MFSLKKLVLEATENTEVAPQEIEEPKVEVLPTEVEEKDPEEDFSEEPTEEPAREELIEELHSAIDDMTDDEIDVLLDYAYAILLMDEEVEADSDEMKESLITHQTAQEKSQMRRVRRTPKWKRKARVRYIRNKKCPAGTTWSSVSKSCSHINIDMSRLQKIIAKMKVRS